jgi:DNA-binding FadR family transcriptional regulator
MAPFRRGNADATQTVSQGITRQLLRRIVDGKYPPGTKLPTERSLALEFSADRHVVREALKRLEALGVLSIRQGSGILVEDLQITGGVELFETYLFRADGTVDETFLFETVQFREDMLRIEVRLAATRRSPEQLEQMKALVLQRRQAMGNPERLNEIMQDLLRVLAYAARNRVYVLVFNTMASFFPRLQATIGSESLAAERTQIALERIVEAIERKDDDLAQLLTYRELQALREDMQREVAMPTDERKP